MDTSQHLGLLPFKIKKQTNKLLQWYDCVKKWFYYLTSNMVSFLKSYMQHTVLSPILSKLISAWFLLNLMIKHDCWCIENTVYNVFTAIVHLAVMLNEKLKHDTVCHFFRPHVYNSLTNYIDLFDISAAYKTQLILISVTYKSSSFKYNQRMIKSRRKKNSFHN